MVDKLPGDITPGIAASGKRVHVSRAGIVDSSESIDIADIARFQGALNEFDISAEYAPEDVVIFNGSIYSSKVIITGGAFDITEWSQISNLPNSSCLISLPTISINGTTEIDIGPFTFVIVDDYTDPQRTDYFFISFSGVTNQPIDNILTARNTTFLVDKNGVLSQESDSAPSERTLREKVSFAFVNHVNQTDIDQARVLSDVQKYNTDITTRELIRQLTGNAGAINNGVSSQVNSVNDLAFDILAGKLWGDNINRSIDRQDPNFKDISTESPSEPIQIFRNNISGTNTILPTSGFEIIPDIYDDGNAGVAATIPIGNIPNNNWTYHEIYLGVETGDIIFVWGQRIFGSKSEAVLDFRTDPFPPSVPIDGNILVGAWVVQDGVSDLGDTAEAEFILGTGASIGAPPLVVEDGFGNVSTSVAGSINNDTVLDGRVTVLEGAGQNHDESIAVSDQSTPLGTGILGTFRVRRSFTLNSIKASVNIPPTGSKLTIDIKKNNVSVLSTLITIDIGGLSSFNAVIQPVISNNTFVDDDKIDIDVILLDVGGTAAGLKLYLLGSTV